MLKDHRSLVLRQHCADPPNRLDHLLMKRQTAFVLGEEETPTGGATTWVGRLANSGEAVAREIKGEIAAESAGRDSIMRGPFTQVRVM